MNIIQRNFFRLLRSGALNEYESLEPMSPYKWRQLAQIIRSQGVNAIAVKGLRNHTFDADANFPRGLIDEIAADSAATSGTALPAPRLCNRILDKRLSKIQEGERHEIDASMTTLELLNIIVRNLCDILDSGISLSGIAELGSYLRTRGDKVDFVKLETWLKRLHLSRAAQLEGSILISVFQFDADEVPFVNNVEKGAYKLTLRTLNHSEADSVEEWNFRQSRTGFVRNNSRQLRRNLRRSWRYVNYAPIETTSHFAARFVRSLAEIEE